MGNRGRLIAPGGLRDELAAVAEDEPAAGESLAEMAAQYGLRPSSARPRLVSYLVKVWQRRHFIFAYATARNVSMYTEARLGQLWQVLTPLLNSAVYYLIFGILFKANRGISNYTAFLVTGVFIFAFTERSIVVGSTVMRANITLIRALHFPRACLSLAYVLVEFQQLLLSMVVLFAIVLGTGEPLTWYWLLLLPTLLIELARLLHPHGVTVELIGSADARARAQIEPAQAAGLLRWHGFVPNDQAMPMLDGALVGLSLLHDEPNFRHSMPTKVVEYMARGVPVVTTPLPAAAELARGHECGFVVPFSDPAAAADAVLELDRDFPLRAKMGRRGHEAAYSSLGWPSNAREFVAQLESWAKSGSRTQ